jgi:histone H3/H4
MKGSELTFFFSISIFLFFLFYPRDALSVLSNVGVGRGGNISAFDRDLTMDESSANMQSSSPTDAARWRRIEGRSAVRQHDDGGGSSSRMTIDGLPQPGEPDGLENLTFALPIPGGVVVGGVGGGGEDGQEDENADDNVDNDDNDGNDVIGDHGHDEDDLMDIDGAVAAAFAAIEGDGEDDDGQEGPDPGDLHDQLASGLNEPTTTSTATANIADANAAANVTGSIADTADPSSIISRGPDPSLVAPDHDHDPDQGTDQDHDYGLNDDDGDDDDDHRNELGGVFVDEAEATVPPLSPSSASSAQSDADSDADADAHPAATASPNNTATTLPRAGAAATTAAGGAAAAAAAAGRSAVPAPQQKPAVQRKPRRQRAMKVSELGVPYAPLALPTVKRMAQRHRGGARLTPETLQALADASDEFLAQAAADCAAYMRHAGRDTLTEADVVLCMKR